MRWKLKNCPRCGGDIFVDSDNNIWYEQCLQCSYRRDMRSIAEIKREPVGQDDKEPMAIRKNDTPDGEYRR